MRCGSPEAYGEGEAVPVWLELKNRRGFASTKQRWPIDVPAAALEPEALAAGHRAERHARRTTMAGFGFFAAKRLCPVVAISYWRWRFVEPRYRVPGSLSIRDIRSSVVMPGMGRGERGLELPGAVIEVKGPTADCRPACGS